MTSNIITGYFILPWCVTFEAADLTIYLRKIAAKQMINCTRGAVFERCRNHEWTEIGFSTEIIDWFHRFLQYLKNFALSKLDDCVIKVC